MASGRESLLVLRHRVRAAQERVLETHQQVTERREERKKKVEPAPRPEIPTFEVPLTNDGQEEHPKVNSTQVMDWFRSALRGLYGDKLTLPEGRGWWTAGEKKLAVNLLKQYGPEKVQKAVAHLCATWEQRVDASEGRLGGIPTINFLWGARMTVMAEIDGVAKVPQRRKGKRGKNTDEYQPPKKPMDIGWE